MKQLGSIAWVHAGLLHDLVLLVMQHYVQHTQAGAMQPAERGSFLRWSTQQQVPSALQPGPLLATAHLRSACCYVLSCCLSLPLARMLVSAGQHGSWLQEKLPGERAPACGKCRLHSSAALHLCWQCVLNYIQRVCALFSRRLSVIVALLPPSPLKQQGLLCPLRCASARPQGLR